MNALFKAAGANGRGTLAERLARDVEDDSRASTVAPLATGIAAKQADVACGNRAAILVALS